MTRQIPSTPPIFNLKNSLLLNPLSVVTISGSSGNLALEVISPLLEYTERNCRQSLRGKNLESLFIPISFQLMFFEFVRTMAKFSCDSDEGALLYMPEGAYYEKLTNRARLNDYIALHGTSLYEYVNRTRSRQLRNGELSIVFSCRKATSWGIATFQSTSPERATELEFIKKEQAEGPSAGSRYMWDCGGAVQAKVGPEEENDDLGMDGDETRISTLRNQCLFVRTLKIKLSEDAWERTFPAKIVVMNSFNEEVSPYKAPSNTSSLSFSPPPSFSPSSSADLGCSESLPTSLSQRDNESMNISDRSSGDEDYNDYINSPPVSEILWVAAPTF